MFLEILTLVADSIPFCTYKERRINVRVTVNHGDVIIKGCLFTDFLVNFKKKGEGGTKL